MSSPPIDDGRGSDSVDEDQRQPHVLFRVMQEIAEQRVGEPTRQGSRRLRIEITPTQMIRLTEELSPQAIHALMLVLEHGYQQGQRTEIVGWGGAWLREHGMKKYQSEKAAAELRAKGYIEVGKVNGNVLGRQLGVVPSGVIASGVPDEPLEPRRDGRPRAPKETAPDGGRSTRFTVSRTPGTGERPTLEAVDNSSSGGSGNRASRIPADRDDERVFPQVSASSRGSGNGSPAASSSRGSEEGLFFLPGPGQTLTRLDLTRFFAQPLLGEAVGGRWEIVVALLARVFKAQSARCAELVEWLGDGVDAHPETRLAQIVVDMAKTTGSGRGKAASAQTGFLRTRGVKTCPVDPDQFIAGFVVTTIAALDSAKAIESWGGWYGAGFGRAEHFQGKVLAAALGIFAQALRDPDALLDPGSDGAAETTYGADDPDYVQRLRTAVEGTVWEDEQSFETLLRNPGQQARILMAYERQLRQQA